MPTGTVDTKPTCRLATAETVDKLLQWDAIGRLVRRAWHKWKFRGAASGLESLAPQKDLRYRFIHPPVVDCRLAGVARA